MKVSVVIPCFNLGEYLKDAIDSVKAQTFKEPGSIVDFYEGPQFSIKKGNKWSGLVDLPHKWYEKK